MKRKKQFPGATAYKDRHGKRRWRYREHGRSVELGTDYGSEEFCFRYETAVSCKQHHSIELDRTTPGS